MSYCIKQYKENEIQLYRKWDGKWSNISSKDFSIYLLGCELIMPYKVITCYDIKIEMALMKKPKKFKELSIDFVSKSDDFLNPQKNEVKTNYSEILIHDGKFWIKKQKQTNQ